MIEINIPPETWFRVICKWEDIIRTGEHDENRNWIPYVICEHMNHIIGGDEYNRGYCSYCPLYTSNPIWCNKGSHNSRIYTSDIDILREFVEWCKTQLDESIDYLQNDELRNTLAIKNEQITRLYHAVDNALNKLIDEAIDENGLPKPGAETMVRIAQSLSMDAFGKLKYTNLISYLREDKNVR